MVQTTVTFPSISTERSDQVVQSLRGLGMRDLGDGKRQYAKVPTIAGTAPIDSSFNLSIDPTTARNAPYSLLAIEDFRRPFTIGAFNHPLRRDFFFYGDVYGGGIFCRHNDNTIRNIKTEGETDNDIRSAPDTIGYPIFFNGGVYIIYPNGEIFQMNPLGDGGTRLTTNFTQAKEEQNIAVGSDSDVITRVAVWLNRVYVEWAGPPGALFNCDINNIRQWLEVDEDLETTLARVYRTTDQILAFHTFGQTGFLFTNKDILSVTVSDVAETLFSFTPLSYKDIYVGGGITKQGALYYVSETGISRLAAGGAYQHISSPVDNVIAAALRDNPNINVVEYERYIIWSFDDSNNTILFYDSIDGTWSHRTGLDLAESGEGIISVGTVSQEGKSWDAFRDETGRELSFDEVTESWDFYAGSGIKPCGVFRDGTIKFFDSPKQLELTMIPERTAFGDAFYIHSIKLPEMTTNEYYVQIRDVDYPTPTETFVPNQYNEIWIERKYSTPEIKFVITNPAAIKSLERFLLDADVVRY